MPAVKFGEYEDGTTARFGDHAGEEGHVMTIAPTGAGKGTTSIIPNLLTWPDSVFVIDPKGENILYTVSQRHKLNAGKVFLLDPFGIVPDSVAGKVVRARFNPLDFIDLGDAGITQADRLADALIVKEGRENIHFTNEARALLRALILHVRTFANYQDMRHLGKVNELAGDSLGLVGDQDAPGEMQKNDSYNGLIARTAMRMAAKAEREGSAVWSTVQANLSQFLDDPRIVRSLRESSFDFLSLTRERISIFAVLPVQYLETFNRWLRLLVESALDRLYEGMESGRQPSVTALFVLDEFAHLGNLEAIKTAYGVARGAGVKIWAILQSLSQLDDIYGQHGRENLIANSGAIEVFRTFDPRGCAYFSQMSGERYVTVASSNTGVSVSMDGGDGNRGPSMNEGTSYAQQLRPRLLPAHIAGLHPDYKLLFRRDRIEATESIFSDAPRFEIIRKADYRNHPLLKKLADL